MKILCIGAGRKRVPGAVTVDINPAVSADVTHDLNRFPWPFESGAFDEIIAHDILEHLDDLVKVMEEIHRVSKNGAKVHITTPHFSCYNSYTDPTHKHHLGFFSFDYFTGENEFGFYTDRKFRKVEAILHFEPSFLNKVISRIAARWPLFYEKHLTWIFPAWFIGINLEVVK